MKKKQNIEVHNEEVREIMKEIPGRLIRWGLTIIFLVFVSIIAGSYFFQFEEIVSAPIIITTADPPAPIICKSTGRISVLFVNDGEFIEKNENIAIIQSMTNLNELKLLKNLITNFDSINPQNTNSYILPQLLNLGELQATYNKLVSTFNNYIYSMKNNLYDSKIGLQKQEIIKQQEHHQLSLQQQKLMKEELNITKKTYERNKLLVGKGGISENQIEEAWSRVLQAQRNYSSFLASLKSEEINIINQKQQMVELTEKYTLEVKQNRQALLDIIQELNTQIKIWKDKYLLKSPIDGKITFTKYWRENHFVSSGERIATVVPNDSSNIICRATVSSSDIGKTKCGQKVNIKLEGYPYMQHGMLSGKINSVPLVPDEEGYIIEIGITNGMISNHHEQLRLIQGMKGTADIITGQMRMIYRFINPLRVLFE